MTPSDRQQGQGQQGQGQQGRRSPQSPSSRSPSSQSPSSRSLSQESSFHYDPCTQDYLTAYLRLEGVQRALHVYLDRSQHPYSDDNMALRSSASASTSTSTYSGAGAVGTGSADADTEAHTGAHIDADADTDIRAHTERDPLLVPWDWCTDSVNEQWALNDYLADTTSLYKFVHTHPHRPPNFRMLVYSGDVDGVCSTIGTQHWVYGVTADSESATGESESAVNRFSSWTYPDLHFGTQQGGYYTQFPGNLTFLTVRHAGHEVPAYQPQKALHMLRLFLSGDIFADTEQEGSSGGSGSSAGVTIALSVLLVLVAVAGLLVCFRSSKDRDSLLGSA